MSRREEILAAARELLEGEGPPAITMRRLAERLGIQAPSLYKHFRDKAELEAGLAALALEELASLLGRAGGLEGLARAYRAWALAHPHLYLLASERPLPPGSGAEAESRAAAALVTAVGEADVARAAWAFAHGMVDLELAGRLSPGAEVEAAWAAGIAAFRGEAAKEKPSLPSPAVFTSFSVD